jgi:hypothetical protein
MLARFAPASPSLAPQQQFKPFLLLFFFFFRRRRALYLQHDI